MSAAGRVLGQVYVQVLIAVAIGAVVGLAFPDVGVQLRPAADVFIQLIRILLVPIIFGTIVVGIARMGDLREVGRIGLRAIVYFEVLSTVALIIGLVIVNFLAPGAGMNINPATLDASALPTVSQGPAVMLLVILISLLVGVAVSLLREKTRPLVQRLDQLLQLLFRIVGLIMRLAPLAAGAGIAFTIGKYGPATLWSLGRLLMTVYLTSVLFVFGVLHPVLRTAGLYFWPFLRYLATEILVVFGTCSTEAVLPRVMQKLEDIGCPKPVVGLVLPAGYVFNADGTCIYLTIATVFVAQATNTQLDLRDQLMVLGVLLLTSKGSAGVAGAGFVTLAATLSTLHTVPVSALVLLLGVDRFLNEARAVTNLIGNCVATVAISRWDRALDLQRAKAVLGKVAVALALVFMAPMTVRAATDSCVLFQVSGDEGLVADTSGGEAQPNFADKVKIKEDPTHGHYIEAAGEQVLSWMAPCNIYAQRGSLSFYWRARDPVGPTPFPLFRVGYADHTSWDMTWLRIDWNGKGFDAFVTDNNLARVRLSTIAPSVPRPDQWMLFTFTWDETRGIALYVDGKLVGSKAQTAVLDSGLDQFGPHSRAISPHQVQSAYQYIRGGDVDDIRVFDHALSDSEVVAQKCNSAPKRTFTDAASRNDWWFRYGWDHANNPPPYLADAATRIRKVEFNEAFDLKERMNGGSDGIPETTWPGVYNRSRLPGRHDYFELPDWNVYVEGGKSITFRLPDEPWNRIEFQGAAYGSLTYVAADGSQNLLTKRPKDEERTWHAVGSLQGGQLRFENVVQETPIQELAAYNITSGGEPDETTLTYTVKPDADPDEYPSLDELQGYIKGRYVPDERTVVAALPKGAPTRQRATDDTAKMPIVHVVIPADFRQTRPGEPVGKFAYGWQGMDAGLDGIAIDIPALQVKPTHGALFPLNIKVKDPLWPGRDMLDVSVSVKPGEARTVFLDTRDRLMPAGKSLYLSIAAAGEDFDARQLKGAKVRLKFKPSADAMREHIADRFAQARDNLAFLVEEHDVSRRLSRYERLDRDLSDLLRVDPRNQHGREMWAELNPEQPGTPVIVPRAPAGVPAWAFLQTEDLKRVRQFIEWWIDNRQVPYGDLGGGISDDDDLTQQWPPLALMGDIPDKVTRSMGALVDAAYRNDMLPLGLGKIQSDELHSYEEALNAKSEAMYVSYGDPKVVERLMESGRAYPKIVEKGADGQTHIVSSLFSATSVARDGPWGWSHPYSYLILHPGIALADFNANPSLRAMIIALADGHMAHGTQAADGSWEFPEDINATTGKWRGVLKASSRGNIAIVQLFWAAYRWTGDEKYLLPLKSELARGPLSTLELLNSEVIDLLGKRQDWGTKLKDEADKGSREPFVLYEAWRTSGDPSYLEKVYSDEITTAEQRMWMCTDAHWWSDRVELFSDILQRSRLGGMALRRNQMFPGHLVSWRFDIPTAAEQVGILVSEGTPRHFKITAYNLTDHPVHAVMTGWDVVAGQWKISRAVEGAADPEAHSAWERTAGLDMTFAPSKTTTWELSLETAGPQSPDRPDLGIGLDDVKVEKGSLRVTVHSLGARPASPAAVVLEDAKGAELARATTPALPPPTDLQPKTARVTLATRAGWKSGMRVRIVPNSDSPEITLLNNTVVAP
jgi:Na+/H+-dicarboxylate symporter